MNSRGLSLFELVIVIAIIAVTLSFIISTVNMRSPEQKISNTTCVNTYIKRDLNDIDYFMALFENKGSSVLLYCEEIDWARLKIGKRYNINCKNSRLINWGEHIE